MLDTATAAARLYGTTPSAPAAGDGAPLDWLAGDDNDTNDTAEPTSDAAAALYPEPTSDAPPSGVPSHIQELRDADPARRLHPADATYSGISDADLIADPRAELDDATRAAAARELREMAADVGASPSEFREVLEIGQRIAKQPPTAEERGAWRTQALRQLQTSPHWQADLALAQRLVQRDPRLARMLDVHGLGDHPRVIEHVVGLAKRERARGRL